MSFREVTRCLVFILLFIKVLPGHTTVSKPKGTNDTGRTYRTSFEKPSESPSTTRAHLETGRSTPAPKTFTSESLPRTQSTIAVQSYTNGSVVSGASVDNCSDAHSFPVTLLHPTKKMTTSCFRYVLINENFCRKRYPGAFVIAIIHSHPKNFKRRSLIRRMWANQEMYERFRLATVFTFGEDPQHPSVQRSLRREWETYEDIVQFSFLDTYKNLTLKAISWLNWAANYCPNATYILKADDDMFVNIFGIVRFLRKQYFLNPSIKAFYCSVWTTMRPERDKSSKWYVSYEEFNETRYPRYCSGSSYSLTMRAVRPLLDSVRSTPFLWVDDAYITGMLAITANVERVDMQSIYLFSYEGVQKNFFDVPSVFVHMPQTMNQRYALWMKTLELCRMEDCSK